MDPPPLGEAALLEARRVSTFRERLLELDASLSALQTASTLPEPISKLDRSPRERLDRSAAVSSVLFSPNTHSTRSERRELDVSTLQHSQAGRVKLDPAQKSPQLGYPSPPPFAPVAPQRRPPLAVGESVEGDRLDGGAGREAVCGLPEDIQAIMLRRSFDNTLPLTAMSLPRMPAPPSRLDEHSSSVPHKPVPTYSEAFLEELQRQHSQRIQEMQDSAQQLLKRKEEEIAHLTSRVREFEELATKAERRAIELERLYESRVADMRKETTKQELETQHFTRKQAVAYEEDMTALKQKYESEIERLELERKQELERKLDEVKRQAEVQQLAMADNFRQQYEQLEEAFAEKLKESQAQYLAHISDLHRCLNQESQRLTSAREEQTNTSMSHRHEIMALQVRVDELLRDGLERDKVHTQEISRLQDTLTHASADWKKKETDYQTLLRYKNQEHQLEKEQQAAALVKKDKRIDELSVRSRELQEQCLKSTAQLDELNSSLDKNHITLQKHIQQNRDLCELVRSLQRDLSLAQSELSLSETELTRLRQENIQFKSELQRFDQILYGKTRTKTTSVR